MSKEIIEKYYQCFNDKNWKGMLGFIHPDVIHESSQGDPQKGRVAFENFLAMMDQHYDEKLTNIVVFSSNHTDRVAAEFTCSGFYKVSADGLPAAHGQKYSIRVGAFFEVVDGKIKRISNHYNMNGWVKQVSL